MFNKKVLLGIGLMLSLVVLVVCFAVPAKASTNSDDQSCTVTVYYKDGTLAKNVKVRTDVSGGISCSGGRDFETNRDGVVTLRWVRGCNLKEVFVKGKGYRVDYKNGQSYRLNLEVNQQVL